MNAMIGVLFYLAIGMFPTVKPRTQQVNTSITTASDGSLVFTATGDFQIDVNGKTYINGVDVHAGQSGRLGLTASELHLGGHRQAGQGAGRSRNETVKQFYRNLPLPKRRYL